MSKSSTSVTAAETPVQVESLKPEGQNHLKSHLKDEGTRFQAIIAGGAAGLVSRFVIAPLDVIKIRLQLQANTLSGHPRLNYDAYPQRLSTAGAPVMRPCGLMSNGAIATLKRILANEGVTGLWKGNVPAELLYVSYSAIQFAAYRSTTIALHRVAGGEHRIPHTVESFVAGGSAGFWGTMLTYPLDLLRTRFAAQGTDRVYLSLRQAVRSIAHDEGYRGFYRGMSVALAQIVPYMGFFFAMYEGLRVPMSRLNLPFSTGDASAGIVASIISKTFVFPLDLVRKRMQVQGPTRARYVYKEHIPEYPSGSSMIRIMRDVAQHEGFRGLYRGLTISLVKAAPASAVTMWTYERVLSILRRHSNFH